MSPEYITDEELDFFREMIEGGEDDFITPDQVRRLILRLEAAEAHA